MIKILFATDNLSAGGKERQLIETLKFIDQTKFSIDLIVFNKNQHYSNEAKELVGNFYEVERGRLKLAPVYKAFKFVKKYHIIHTWDTLSTFYFILSSKLHNRFIIDGSIRDAGIEKGWSFVYKKFTLNNSNLIIANSHAGLRAYNVKGKVIYNSISLERFLVKRNTNEFNIIHVANFSDYKDHNCFFQAMTKLIYDKIIDKVYVVGDGKNRTCWESYLLNNHTDIVSNFIFTGSIYNVEEYLSICRVGVLCSTEKYKEGLSNAVLEYMASGLIPIVTNVGAIPEIIKDGENGFLFPSSNSEKLYEIIKQIKNADNASIIKNAQSTIKEKFNKRININRLENLYQNIYKNLSIK